MQAPTSALEANKAVLRRWFEEVWNLEHAEVIDELLAPDCEIHDGPVTVKGPAEFRVVHDRFRSAFTNIRFTLHEVIAEGDIVSMRCSSLVIHSGDGLGLPATGKEVSSTGMAMVRIRDGKIAEVWQNWDMLGMMHQIEEKPLSKTYMVAE